MNKLINTCKFGEYIKKVKDQSYCPICIDNYFRELSCKHVFHKKCIYNWFKKYQLIVN